MKTDKTLKNKAVNIKGKQYVLVSDRILSLAENWEHYSIENDATFYPEEKMWVVRSILTIGENKYTGHAQEIIGDGYINATSALENCETSAVGRACAMAGIGVIDSIASVDEINKAGAREQYNNKGNDKPWYNGFEKGKSFIADAIARGDVDHAGAIARLEDKYKVSKATKEAIMAL